MRECNKAATNFLCIFSAKYWSVETALGTNILGGRFGGSHADLVKLNHILSLKLKDQNYGDLFLIVSGKIA